ncbi:gamma-secretase aspartyl protease complex, presenilin enhancer-2 subunit [Umbelopsis sp. PMI_123]|nr:gamma-secretase aspartyl protease complex, presenilin enhancer-2 subunit [Umbelopsis sp. PMI_123]
MPSLDKMSGSEILSIGKKMFYGGFAFLPLLWLVNVIYLWTSLKRTDVPIQLRKYLIYSIAGCLAWFIALTTWYALFVNKRVAWGATADRITVVIPKGV